MKDKKSSILILCFIAITIIFFTYQVVITYDTSHYLWLTSLLTPEGNFSEWDVARGPVFPMFIRICNILFGQSVNGVLIGMFAFYLLMLIGCYLIYKDTIKDEECFGKKMKWILAILFIVFIVINPMIIGYYHTLLTEFIGMTFAVIGCYLAWKWISVDFWENKVKYSIYTIVLAILTSLAWNLKQPYVSTILFPILVAAVISFVRKTNLKNFIQRLVTILICAVILVVSIKIWNIILEKNEVEFKQERTSAGFLANSILGGLKDYNIKKTEEFNTVQEIEENEKLSDEDKINMKEIIDGKSEYKSFLIIDIQKENYKLVYTKNEAISTGEAIKFLLSSCIREPISILGNYITNYLATISIYDIEFIGTDILINKNINFKSVAEIGAIGFKIYGYANDCVFYLSPELEPYATEYRAINKPVVTINWVMRNMQYPSIIVLKISFLLLPILTIISIISVFLTKKRYNEKYHRLVDLIAILYTFSFLHIAMHAILGATIDRYTMPALATTIIGILLTIYAIVYRKKYKIQKIEREKNEKM